MWAFFFAVDLVDEVGVKPVLGQPVPAPHLVERQRHQQSPDVDRRRHLQMHVQRCRQQPERREHQQRRNRIPDHVPAGRRP